MIDIESREKQDKLNQFIKENYRQIAIKLKKEDYELIEQLVKTNKPYGTDKVSSLCKELILQWAKMYKTK